VQFRPAVKENLVSVIPSVIANEAKQSIAKKQEWIASSL